MAAETFTALVVRGTDWSETSRIVTLFTREVGKVRALAKGGRRLNSTFEIALDLLTVARVGVIRKGHGGLDLLTEALVDERFPHLRTNLDALYSGYYAAELLADGTQDYDPHPELFDAAVQLLRDTAAGPGRVAGFELVWLHALGYSPRFDGCGGCGSAVPDVPRVPYSQAAGGVLCGRCLPAATDRRFITAAARDALRRLPAVPPPAARAEVRAVLGQAVCYVLGRRPKLLGYVDGNS